MEAFTVSSAAVAVSKRKRRTAYPDVVAKAVALARQVGALHATNTINKTLPQEEHLLEDSVRKWLCRWKKEGEFWKNPGKRGRPSIADSVPGAKEEWVRQVDSFRNQGESVTGRVSATIMRSVLAEKAPSFLTRQGGVTNVSMRTGANLLASSGMSFRKKTSSRILPPVEELEGTRDKFYRT